MNEKLKPFLALQALDSRRLTLRRKLEAALKRKEALKGDLTAAQAGKAKADEAKKIREKHLMDAQLRLKSAEERRRQTELKQTKISNQKEFQAIADQLATQKAEISGIEDEALGLMDAVDGVRRDAEFAAKALRDQEARSQRIDAELDAATEESLAEIAKLDQDVAALEAACDRDLLVEYRRLVKRTNGMAIAPATGGVCQGCYTRLPPQIQNLLAGGGVVNCPSCQVFLYLD
jgi:uncharacterized protein